MVLGLNKVCLIGNVGKKPEIRTMQNGQKMASFSVATSEEWRDKEANDKKSKTEWHKIVVFQEGLVKVIEGYVEKGSKLYIEGKLQTRKWENNDGIQGSATEVVLQGYSSVLLLLDRKPQEQDQTSPVNKESGFEAYSPADKQQ